MALLDTRAFALSAAAGLAVAAACKDRAPPGGEPGGASAAVSAGLLAAADKACCMGLNECKGKGGCAVPGKNDCAGKNECKGKGGCNMHCPK